MSTKLLPAFVKRRIIARIRAIADSGLPGLYIQSHPAKNTYVNKPKTAPEELPESDGLPVPPEELWAGYGNYLSEGQRDVTEMIRILEADGFPVANAKRILDFGCGAGRMIRHLPELAPNAELWGVDISAPHIRWCIDNLTPAIHFATTTMVPHLPFEDRFFDLIFCGSVFTHLEDIQESWLLELGRLLRPSGRLYITIHDEHTVKVLDQQYRDNWLARTMSEQPAYCSNKDNFNMMVIGRGAASQVFYNSGYFRFVVPPIFRWMSLTPESYGYQSAVVLEKLGGN